MRRGSGGRKPVGRQLLTLPACGPGPDQACFQRMLCLSVSVLLSDPLAASDGSALSRGVGIELIDILPR